MAHHSNKGQALSPSASKRTSSSGIDNTASKTGTAHRRHVYEPSRRHQQVSSTAPLSADSPPATEHDPSNEVSPSELISVWCATRIIHTRPAPGGDIRVWRERSTRPISSRDNLQPNNLVTPCAPGQTRSPLAVLAASARSAQPRRASRAPWWPGPVVACASASGAAADLGLTRPRRRARVSSGACAAPSAHLSHGDVTARRGRAGGPRRGPPLRPPRLALAAASTAARHRRRRQRATSQRAPLGGC
jgi:hypothetical protein